MLPMQMLCRPQRSTPLQWWAQVVAWHSMRAAFANCVAVIWPVCAVSAAVYLLGDGGDFSWGLAAPYLLGGLAGGLAGGRVFGGVSVPWLRRIFGVFLLYGAARYLL